MAAGGQMAEFFATLGVKINKADIVKVDKTLDHIEERAKRLVEGTLSNMKVQITGYRFSEGFNSKLYKGVQKKLTILNNKKGLSPEITISKFDVDKGALLREMKAAVDYVESNLRVRIRPDITRPSQTGSGAPREGSSIYGGVSRFGTGMGLGAAAGGLGRGFIPGLGLAFGVSQLNRLNQQLIGQDLAATAVFGNQEAGQEQIQWLRSLGNQIGFDYRSQANPYMKMAAAGMTAGMETSQVQSIFRSMAEYGRVMGLNDEDMKGSMRAVEQMLNKGQVYAEELKMQLGEKFPAAIQLMAEAVAGGDTEKLFDMMEKGEVKSLEALPKFADILARQARVGGALTKAMKTSLAEQMRFNNTFNDLVMFFSESGFEKGQAGIFRVMADFFKEMKPLLQGFGEAWNYVGSALRIPLGLLVDLGRGLETLSKWTGASKGQLMAFGTVLGLLAFPLTRTLTVISGVLAVVEDFTAFLSGRGSLFGSFFDTDVEKERARREFLKAIKTTFDSIKDVTDLILTGWREIFQLMGDNPAEGFLNFVKAIANEVRATADAAMRVAKALGYKEDIDETERLRKIQERAEQPKSTFELAVGRLKDVIRYPFGLGAPDNSETILKNLGETTVSYNNPFLMSDKDVRESYFTPDQTYRLGGESSMKYESLIGNITFSNFNGTRESQEEITKQMERVVIEQLKPVVEKARSGSQ